ncbi:MAG TPA: class I SAM-dependent methyltransferase [Terracidiphilus sp.]|nr:class I SAM-dependent methyltransferase [Terracidiphilus sp.]
MSQQSDWIRIDFHPAIVDLPPFPVLQHVPPGSTVLDVGCNQGSNALLLAQHGFRVLGIDINSAAIDAAKMRKCEIGAAGCAEFRVADILEEPFADQFDVVMLIRVLTCFAESAAWNALLKRITHLLNPGGYLYVHDFLASPDIEAYRRRYEAGARLGWRAGNFQVNNANGNRLFIAHHHSEDEVASIVAGYEQLSYASHESLSLNGNRCRMFEFLGRKPA